MNYSSLSIPRWLREGIQPNHRGSAVRKFLYGGDTETCEGAPITFQFAGDGVDDLLWLDAPEHASAVFAAWCRALPGNAVHVVYVHNLAFDLVSLFWDRRELLVSDSTGEFSFELEGWAVSGVYGAPTFARLVDKARKRTVMVIDSFSYYRASLARAADVFCPGLPKLARPEGLGTKRYAPGDAEFERYAMRDAVVAWRVGEALEKLHVEFDLKQTVSVADMAARIFRHHYLKRPIPLPDRAVTEAALLAYHGGKNGLYCAPGWYQGVSSLDISSAYPHAMAGLPSFSVAEAYRKYSAKRPRTVPVLGVYLVSGVVAPCAWPCLFGHGFDPLRGGEVADVWVAGHDLNEALRAGEFKPASVSGWVYDADRDPHPAPLREFVAEFYQRKESETDKGKRAMYKFILNSISGKFVQTKKRRMRTVVDVDAGSVGHAADLVAGGLFHPFIASIITAHTRARMHQLEHRYAALHTATDGLFVRGRVAPGVLGPPSGLGAVVNEAFGDLLLLRNKLYVLYGEGVHPTLPASSVFDGRHIIKAALHGFAGSVADLERLATTEARTYTTQRANRLRESVNRGLTPNAFGMRDFRLKVGALGIFPA